MKKMILAVIGMVALAGTATAAENAVTTLDGKAYQCRQEIEVSRPMWQRVLSLGTLSEFTTIQREVSVDIATMAQIKAEAADYTTCEAAIAYVSKVGGTSYHLACQIKEGQVAMVELTDKSCGYTWRKGKL